jgi:hypothetical protein
LEVGSPQGDFAVYRLGELIGIGETKDNSLIIKTML